MWFLTSTAKGREGGPGAASEKLGFELGLGARRRSAREVLSWLVEKQFSWKFQVQKGCFPPLKSGSLWVCAAGAALLSICGVPSTSRALQPCHREQQREVRVGSQRSLYLHLVGEINCHEMAFVLSPVCYLCRSRCPLQLRALGLGPEPSLCLVMATVRPQLPCVCALTLRWEDQYLITYGPASPEPNILWGLM